MTCKRCGYDGCTRMRYVFKYCVRWYLCAIFLSEPIQKWLEANPRSMKDHVYPDDIKKLPIKLLPPKRQKPFIDLARERHLLWSEVIELEARGCDRKGSMPVWQLVRDYRVENPRVRFYKLMFLDIEHALEFDPAFRQEPLRGLDARGEELLLGRRVVARIGPKITKDRAAATRVLARLLGALPATFAEREAIDEVPATADGLLGLGAYLDEQASAAPSRYARIEEIGRELDELAWKLYA